MDDSYVIENGEIKLTLSDADLEDILEDVKGCRDILEPQIRLNGNTVIFRDQDIKLIDPVTFFIRDIPKTVMSKRHKIACGILCVLLLAYFTLISSGLPPILIFINSVMGILFGTFIYYAFYNYLVIAEIKRQRKALYVKAKLLSFFYMVILQELTTTTDRLERSNNRMNNEHMELKSMYKRLFLELPNEIRAKVPDRFPDGEEIHPENRNYS